MVIAYRFASEANAQKAMAALNKKFGFVAILDGEILIVTSYDKDAVPAIEAIVKKHKGEFYKLIRSRS